MVPAIEDTNLIELDGNPVLQLSFDMTSTPR